MSGELTLAHLPVAMRKVIRTYIQDSPDSPEATRKVIVSLRNLVDLVYMELGELLDQVYGKKYYKKWGFETFEAYVNEELAFSKGKSISLRQVYKEFKINLGIGKKDLEGVGWTKARTLLPIVKSGVNPREIQKWLKKAREVPSRELEAEVRKELGKTNNGRDSYSEYKSDKKTFEVRLLDEQWDNVKQALTVAEEMSNSPYVAVNLDMMCLAFIHGHLNMASDKTLKAMLAAMERHFKVKVIAFRKNDNPEAIQAIMKNLCDFYGYDGFIVKRGMSKEAKNEIQRTIKAAANSRGKVLGKT